MHRHYKIFVIGILIIIAVSCNYGFASAQPEKDVEIYHILQKGYISIKGQTNIFDFTGKAIQHEGQLIEENGRYTGTVILRFNNLDMDLPYAKKVLNDPEYMDANHYPMIKIVLDKFHPEEAPAQVNGALTLHGISSSTQGEGKASKPSTPMLKPLKSVRNFRQSKFKGSSTIRLQMATKQPGQP